VCVRACDSGMTVSFKYGYNSRFLPYGRDVLLSQAYIKYMPKNRKKYSMTNPKISSPTDSEDFSLLLEPPTLNQALANHRLGTNRC
jgi:hypothetical protein